ncbi:hypothetical protein ES705_13499 [subsurface metagenome]
MYNEGGQATSEGDLETAIQKFNECIAMCTTLYEEEDDADAEELMYTLQNNIPKLYYQLSKEKLQAQEIKSGLDNAYKAKETAEEYSDSETLEKINKLIPQVHYKIGVGKYKKGDIDGALVEFDNAIVVDQNYASAHYMNAVVYKKQEDDAKFIEASKKALEAANVTNNGKIKINTEKLAGGYFLKKGNEAKASSNYDEALKNLKLSVGFKSDNATAYYLLTSVYNAKKDWDNAIASANEGLKYEESSAEAKARFYFEMGNAYSGKGDNTSACDTYSKALVGDYLEHAKYQMEYVIKCN